MKYATILAMPAYNDITIDLNWDGPYISAAVAIDGDYTWIDACLEDDAPEMKQRLTDAGWTLVAYSDVFAITPTGTNDGDRWRIVVNEPLARWQADVAAGLTQRGYDDWLAEARQYSLWTPRPEAVEAEAVEAAIAVAAEAEAAFAVEAAEAEPAPELPGEIPVEIPVEPETIIPDAPAEGTEPQGDA